MRSRARAARLLSETELYTAALRALMRRAHSVREMREYLKSRAENSEHVLGILQKLREQRYLDDARYALDFARIHAQSRSQGRYRIARELRVRGVGDAHIEAALDAILPEESETQLLRARIARQRARLRGEFGPRQFASLYRSLLRAGFSAEAIRSELRRVSRGDPADLPSEAGEEN